MKYIHRFLIFTIFLVLICFNNSHLAYSINNTITDYNFDEWYYFNDKDFLSQNYGIIDNKISQYIVSTGEGSISIPIDFKGNYGIYVSIIGDSSEFIVSTTNNKFIVDPRTEFFSRNRNKNTLKELFISNISLDNEDKIEIIFNSPNAKLVNLRLLKLTDEEYTQWLAPESNNKNFLFDNDLYTDFFQGENSSYNMFKYNTIEQYENLSVNILNYCVGTTFFPFYNSSYAGEPYGSFNKYKNAVRVGDITAYNDFMNLYNTYGDPIKIISSSEKTFDLFLTFRMNSFLPNDYRGFLNGNIYNDFSSKTQKFNHKISFYYEDYREYLLNIILESTEKFHPKGITLDFSRTPNFFGYELLNRNARKKILSEFVKTIREEVPDDIKIMVRFPYNYTNYDLDVPLWISEAYVDYISPTSLKYEEFFDITPFVEMVKDSSVKLYPSITSNLGGEDLDINSEKSYQNKGLFGINNEYLSVSDYLLRAIELYEKGAHGVLLFNVNTQIGEPALIPTKLKLLNGVDSLEKWYYFEYLLESKDKEIKFID
ncbi:hypothetical protein [Oceanirhabdus seepicola]|uniref:Glycosyl hydrolase-like 10 domain-containing protein n=1 Tax=Oceanirhabdus seepicola TaxID=2828781 RepID=A0A9J6NX53_9CLOT|nr:hypothetical protein [Oceanirhabdus seepicola]MCM1988473.1 hypothetical protein [Oceanirhabdus seepicola]